MPKRAKNNRKRIGAKKMKNQRKRGQRNQPQPKSVGLARPPKQVYNMVTGQTKQGLGIGITPSVPSVHFSMSKFSDGKRDGVKMNFCGPIFIADQLGAGTIYGHYSTIGSTDASDTPVTIFDVNPQFLLPRIGAANLAFGYSRFRFTRLKFTWVGARTTQADEAVTMGYIGDPAKATNFTTYGSLLQCVPSMVSPIWASTSIDVSKYLVNQDWFYSDDVASTGVDLRFNTQASLMLGFSAVVNAKTQGYLYVEGELLLVEPQAYGLTSSVSLVAKRLKEIRAASREIPLPSEKKEKNWEDEVDETPTALK